ncbi:hypothetical protein J6A31_07575 [bacterium]|nr:hypothetical protein [bacterium]
MGRHKKDAKYLTAYVERTLHEEFEAFCAKMGQSKTVATERALRMYMDSMNAALDEFEKKGVDSDNE